MKVTNLVLLSILLSGCNGGGSSSSVAPSSKAVQNSGTSNTGGTTTTTTRAVKGLMKIDDHNPVVVTSAFTRFTKRLANINFSSFSSYVISNAVADDEEMLPEVVPDPTLPDPYQTKLSADFQISFDAAVEGGGGSMVNGSVVGGVNSVAYIIVQYEAGGMSWDQKCNYYQWTLQTDEIGTNSLYLSVSKQVGGSCQQDPPVFSLSNPGSNVSMRVSRDSSNTYFEYSLDNGTTWLNGQTIALSSFDSGDTIVQGEIWNGSSVSNCSLNGVTMPCKSTPPVEETVTEEETVQE